MKNQADRRGCYAASPTTDRMIEPSFFLNSMLNLEFYHSVVMYSERRGIYQV